MYLHWLYQFIRFYRTARLDYMSRVERSTLSDGVRLYSGAILKHSTIGESSYIGRNSHVQYATIGSYCSIASNVMIGGGVHPLNKISTHPDIVRCYTTQVVIGSDCWIGQGAIILDGVRIGNGAVVAAGSVVSHNVKQFRIVGGVPATVIGERKVQDEMWY